MLIKGLLVIYQAYFNFLNNRTSPDILNTKQAEAKYEAMKDESEKNERVVRDVLPLTPYLGSRINSRFLIHPFIHPMYLCSAFFLSFYITTIILKYLLQSICFL